MENELNDVDINNEDESLEEELEENEEEDKPEEPEVKTEKPKETPEAKKARLERQLERLNKHLGVDKKPETKETSTKSSEIDFGQLAFHNTKSGSVRIESDEDIAFLEKTIEETGKSQQAILGSKWFTEELKEIQEQKRSSSAIPKGGNRSANSTKDSVDYWVSKGELPENTPANQELRRKIVNARYKRETSDSKFSPSFTGKVTRQSQLKK